MLDRLGAGGEIVDRRVELLADVVVGGWQRHRGFTAYWPPKMSRGGAAPEGLPTSWDAASRECSRRSPVTAWWRQSLVPVLRGAFRTRVSRRRACSRLEIGRA